MAKSRAEVVEEHIEDCFKGVKDGKKQSQEDSLAFISQSLVDLNFTLALMYDEMMKEREGEHGNQA